MVCHIKTLNLRYFDNKWSKYRNLLQNKGENMDPKSKKDIILGCTAHQSTPSPTVNTLQASFFL